MKATTVLRAYIEAHTEWAEAQQVVTRTIVQSVMRRGGKDVTPLIESMTRRNGLLDRCENRLLRICEEADAKERP